MNTQLFSKLQDLKLLRKLTKSLGSRIDLVREVQLTRIEYPISLSEVQARESTVSVLERLSVSSGDIVYVPVKNLSAGVRVFHDGKILDLSLDMVEAKLLKTF